MAICITGATGFLGSHLVPRLAEEKLRVVTRSGPQPQETVTGNLRDEATAGRLIHDGDTLVHLAYQRDEPGVNLAIAENLARIASDRARRVVLVSTAAVFGNTPDERVDEGTTPQPVSEYQNIKLQIEEIFRDSLRASTELVVLRPTAVFGRGGQNLRRAAASLRRASPAVNYLRRSLYGRRRMNLVGVENVCEAIVHSLNAAASAGSLFIVSDDEDPKNNYEDVSSILCAEMQCRQLPLRSFRPVSLLLPVLLRMKGAWPANPQQTFSSKRIRASGYTPVLSLEQGLRAFARDLAPSNGTTT